MIVSDEIQLEGKEGQQITITNNGNYTLYSDGLIIKYDAEGAVEWAKSFGGDGYTDDNVQITSVVETKDGGYIVGGYFKSKEIQLEGKDGQQITITRNSNFAYSDGLIIKYDAEGAVEWAKSFGGDDDDYIQSVAATNDIVVKS